MVMRIGEGGGAGIPVVPGTTGAGFAPPTPQYTTGFLQETGARLAQVRATTSLALQGAVGTPYVWMGSEEGIRLRKQKWNPKAAREHSLRSIDSLISEFEASSYEEKKRMAKLLAMAGYISIGSGGLEEAVEEATLMEVTEAYATLLSSAAARFAAGQNISPDQLLEMNIRYNMGKAGVAVSEDTDIDSLFSSAVEKSKPKTIKTTDKQIDLFSPEDARGLARATLQQTLGRDPTEAEYEDFVAALQTAARTNPTITTTRTHFNAEGEQEWQRTRTSGGLSEAGIQQVLQEEAEETPGYAEWQAVGTYFPAAMAALGSAVPNA